MKTKKSLFFTVLIVLVLVLVSCETSVSIVYNQPSEINMGSYRNVAVASTVPFKGMTKPPFFVRAIDVDAFWDTYITSSYDTSISEKSAKYATKKLVATLEKSGFFNVTPPEKTDVMLNSSVVGVSTVDALKNNNIDAVIIPKITSLSINEFIQSKKIVETDYNKKDAQGNPTKVTKTVYYLYQNVDLGFSYTIIDAKTQNVVAVKNFNSSDSRSYEVDKYGFLAPDPYSMIQTMIDSYQGYISKQLVPTKARKNVSLMANKPKVEELKVAYKAAEDGYTSRAAELFLREYNATGHIPSGYNAALLTAAVGDIDGAIELLNEMSLKYSNSDVEKLLSNLVIIKQRNDEALKQLSGEVTHNFQDNSTNIFQVIMGN